MVSQKALLLVRHGRIEDRFQGCFVGSTDVPLAANGRTRIASLARYVGIHKPSKCICSPLKRARQTAEILAGVLNLDVDVDPDLREVDFGRWEGLTFQEIAESDPELVDKWAAWEDDFAFPGGESLGRFFGRVRKAADRFAADPAQAILMVSHGGVIRAMICHFLGLDQRRHVLFDIRHAALTRVELSDGRGVLAELNSFSRRGD